MKCPACHHASALDAAFCEECGVRLEGLCPGCGEVTRPGANFCGKCGHLLVESALEPPAAFARFGSPKVYTPPHLVDKIVTSRAALEGERKQVTVLFADLKGSMEHLGRPRSRGRARRCSIPCSST